MHPKSISWEIDPATECFVRVSDHAHEVLGHPLEAWYEKDFWRTHLHPEDSQRAVEHRNAGIQRPGHHECEYRMLAADGSHVWFRDITSDITPTDATENLFGTLIDITQDRLARDTLLENEQLFDQAARIANIGHWQWDEINDQLEMCSPEQARIYGISVADYFDAASTLEKDLDWIHPDDRDAYSTEIASYVAKNGNGSDNRCVLDVEYRIINRRGETRHVHELAEPMFDADGRHIRSNGTMQDITSHKRIAEKLDESQERLRAILDNSPIAILMKDTEGRYLFVNNKFSEWYGSTPEETIGQRHHQFTDPGNAVFFAKQDQEILHERAAKTWELQQQFSDGQDHAIIAHKFPIFGANDQVIGIGGIDVDITQYKRAEERNARLGSIIEQSINEIYVFDANTLKFLQVNKGARDNLGYSAADLSRLSPLDIKPKFSSKGFAEITKSLSNGFKSQVIFETVHQRKDSTQYPVEIHLQYMGSETPPVYIAVVQDITERKQAEQILQWSHDELETRILERTRQMQEEIEERRFAEKSLRESEERVRNLAEVSSDWFWEMDKDLQFSYFSEQFKNITGLDPKSFIGKQRKEIVATTMDQNIWHRHLEDLDNRIAFRDFEYEMDGLEGNRLYVRISGVPIFNEQKEFVGYRGTTTNLTDQVLAERRASHAEHQLADAIEGLPDSVCLYDHDERFVMCNSKYRDLFSDVMDILVPGALFEDICRLCHERGLVPNWQDDQDGWVQYRVARFRNPQAPTFHQGRNGGWFMSRDIKTSNGGTFIMRTDVTDLKENQTLLDNARRTVNTSDQ